MITQMEKIDNSLSKVFKTEPLQNDIIIANETILPEIVDDELIQIENDHQQIRENIFELIVEGSDALQHALDLAKASDQPRAYEVVAGLLKSIAEMNGQILDLHEKKQNIKKKLGRGTEETDKPSTTINNAIFCGTTAELSKMIGNFKGE